VFYRGGKVGPNVTAAPDTAERATHLLIRPQPLEHRLVPESHRPRSQPGGLEITHAATPLAAHLDHDATSLPSIPKSIVVRR